MENLLIKEFQDEPYRYSLSHEMNADDSFQPVLLEEHFEQIIPVDADFCPMYTLEEAIEKREKEDYSPEVQHIIDLITVQEDLLPVGSAKYAVHKYPSDVDIFEKITGCCTINKIRFDVANAFQDIIQRVEASDDIFVGDIKAGYDNRFDIYLGEEIDGKVIDYNQTISKREIQNLYNQGLLNRSELNELMGLAKENPTLEEFTKLINRIKEFHVLRWTPEEILRSYKMLPGNKKYYLYDALIDRSVVKLDLWAPLPYENIDPRCLEIFEANWASKAKKGNNGLLQPWRYIEVTNWILIILQDLEGNERTLTQELPDYARSLRRDVLKYVDPESPNYLKATKRFWSYLLFERRVLQSEVNEVRVDVSKDLRKEIENQRLQRMISQHNLKDVNRLIRQLSPLFGSYVSFLNSIKGDAELILDLRKKKVPISQAFFLQSVDGMILRVTCYPGGCLFDPLVNRELLPLLKPALKDLSKLEDVIKYLKRIINEMTLTYLSEKKIDIHKSLFPQNTPSF